MRTCGIAAAFIAATAGGAGQELAWVRQMGSPSHDSFSAMAEDPDANVYILGQFQGTMTVGGSTLDSSTRWAVFIAKVNSRGEALWANAITTSFAVEPGSIAIDPAGFLYVTGAFTQTAEFGTNHLEALDPESCYGFLAKYDLNGRLLWAKRYGTQGTRASSVVVSRTGGVFLSGTYRESTTLGDFFLTGTGLGNLWVAKLNGEGEVQRVSAAGPANFFVAGPKLAIDSNDNLFLAGGFIGAMSFPQGAQVPVTNTVCATNQVLVPQTEWVTNVICLTNLNTDPIQITCSNVLTAITTSVLSNSVDCITVITLSNLNSSFELNGLPNGRSTMFLARYDSDGNCLWAREGGGPASALAPGTNGELYVTGAMQRPDFGKPYYTAIFDGTEIIGQNALFLAKFDAAGHVVWVNNEGGSALALGPEGEVYATSTLEGTRNFAGRMFTPLGYQDLFVSRYDSLGNPLSAWQIGDGQGEMAGAITVDRSGTVFVAGVTFHDSASNTYQQTNYGGWDIMLAKLARQGPQIVTQPRRVVIRQGEEASFSVEVTNAISARFQWLRNGTPLTDAPRISGSRGPVLRIQNAESADEAEYNVQITADNGQVISAIAQLRMEGLMQFTKSEKGQYGEFLVSFSGVSGHLYDIEISSDCRNWAFLTNGFCFQGTLTVSDFSNTNSAQRFYRAVAH